MRSGSGTIRYHPILPDAKGSVIIDHPQPGDNMRPSVRSGSGLARVIYVALVALVGLWDQPATAQQAAPATVLTNVSLLDGTGATARPATVRIVGDRIESVGAPTTLRPAPTDR